MIDQYSEPSLPLLALDTASPTLSVAVGRGGEVLARREAANARPSPSLLRLIDECLTEAGVDRGDLGRELGGVIAVQGPGSFTGLRVGLATVLGLHQALGLPATAVPTFAALAWQAAALEPEAERILTAVDALRGEWFSQLWSVGSPRGALEEPRLRSTEALVAEAPCRAIGFGLERAVLATGGDGGLRLTEPTPLAATLLELAVPGEVDWDSERLTRPLYLRPPATRTGAR